MTEIHKEYARPFLLEPTKLARIVDIIHKRLADHQHTTPRDQFSVFLTGDRREELPNVDDVLALDNSRKQRIQRLLITCSASTAGAVRPEHEVQVDFPSSGSPTSIGPDNTKKTAVAISVRSDDRAWTNRTLSEVEEQVERTWQRYLPSVLLLLGIALFSVLVFAFLFIEIDTTRSLGMWLQDADLDRVEAMVSGDRTITDEELREVVTRQLRNVLDDARPQRTTDPARMRQFLFVSIPLAVIVLCAFLLMFTCYRPAVFLWGDEVERHGNMRTRRNILWSFIIGTILMGLVSRLFSEGVMSLF